jgi:adenylate cyclase
VEGAGLLDDEMVLRLARLLGASFSRIADVQVDALDEVLLALGADASREPKDRLTELVDQHDNGVLALLESAMVYVWRRHLVAAIGRSLALDAGSTDLAVGFADISGFSSLVQTLTAHELAAVVDAFEVAAFDVVSAGGGHVVKLIGDEVLFTAPTVTQAVDIAMDLMDRMAQEPTMPQLHCGIAHGPTVDVGGDVFGNTVNLAARLTSVARRSTAVIPREHLADLAEREDLDVRRVRRVYDLKGFGATKVAVVRRRAPGEEGGLRRRRSRDAEDRSSDRRDDLSELEEQ